jgi:hypothetical protein
MPYVIHICLGNLQAKRVLVTEKKFPTLTPSSPSLGSSPRLYGADYYYTT